MSHRTFNRIGLVVVAAWGLTAPSSPAQDPLAAYNQSRAYKQFLNSPASIRTFSSMQSGWIGGGYDTPIQSARFWLTPGYYHEEISPFGRQTYTIPQQAGVTIVTRPLLILPPPVVVTPFPFPMSLPR